MVNDNIDAASSDESMYMMYMELSIVILPENYQCALILWKCDIANNKKVIEVCYTSVSIKEESASGARVAQITQIISTDHPNSERLWFNSQLFID